MNRSDCRLGMLLKGYPRISESFISTEILLLESLGIPVEIYSLRQPRENFHHDHVKKIKAPVTYIPEYVIPNWRVLVRSNAQLWKNIGARYPQCFAAAVLRACDRRKAATLRHFLQAGYLCAIRLHRAPVAHIHAHFCHTPASVAFFASQLTGIPFSFTAHAKDIYTSERKQLARKIRAARFIVTCTGYNAEYLSRLAEEAGCNTPIHAIYHGIDLDLFSFGHHPPTTPPYRILSVGRLVEKKGYDDLLKALALLDCAGLNFEFIHIGSGEQEKKIRDLARTLGLESRIKMFGTLPHSEVVAHYRQAHCLALACKVAPNGDRDGIPNVLVEAMAIGLPVVATNVSAIPELIENGVTGVLTRPEDPSAMADALARVLLHPEELPQMARRARTRVEESFDNRVCIKRLYDLFRQIVERP